MEIYCNKRRRKEKMGKNMEGKTCAVVCVCVCVDACVGGLQSHSTEVRFAKTEHKHTPSPFPFI